MHSIMGLPMKGSSTGTEGTSRGRVIYVIYAMSRLRWHYERVVICR